SGRTSHGRFSGATTMRLLVFILALLAAAASGFGGLALNTAVNHDPKIKAEFARLDKLDDNIGLLTSKPGEQGHTCFGVMSDFNNLIDALLAVLPLGIVGGLLALNRKKWLASLLLLVAAVTPIYSLFQIKADIEAYLKVSDW